MLKTKSKRKLRKEKIFKLACYVSRKLMKSDVIVQRYNSQSSQSVYLKLDHGVLGTIRISDHKENNSNEYKYNVLTSCNNVITLNHENNNKYYFPLWKKDLLIKLILDDRKEHISMYSKGNYESLKDIAIAKNYSATGFWHNSNII